MHTEFLGIQTIHRQMHGEEVGLVSHLTRDCNDLILSKHIPSRLTSERLNGRQLYGHVLQGRTTGQRFEFQIETARIWR